MQSDVYRQSEQFGEIDKQINSVYADYARSVGLSYTSLHALHMVMLTKNCTQKIIIEQTFLPKQTVNSVISAFCKQGIMELKESPEDRRVKTIHLTEKGQKFAKSILPQITESEIQSMAQFTDEERNLFLKFMKKYADTFEKMLRK